MSITSKRYFPYLIILIFSFVLYGNTIKNEFSLDDEMVIKDNELVHQGVSAIPEIFTSPYYTGGEWSYGYRPFTKAFFALEYELFGQNPLVHHFINILLYACLGFLLYFIFSLIFKNLIAQHFWLLVTLIYLAHPIHTEVVTSLKNREEIFSMIFGLLSLWMFFRFFTIKEISSLLFAFVFFVFSLLSKESAASFVAIIPLTLILYNVLNKKSLSIIFKNIPFYIIIFILFIATYSFSNISQWFLPDESVTLLGFENPLHENYGLGTKLYLFLFSYWKYFSLLILPHPLVFYYGMYTVPDVSWGQYQVWGGLGLIIILSYLSFKYFKLKPLISYSILFFIVGIFPFTNILIPINGIIAERLVFISSFGFSIITISLLYYLFKGDLYKNVIPIPKKINFLIVFVAILSLYTFKTIARNSSWKDGLTLYENDLQYLENSVKAHDIYATALFDKVYKDFNYSTNKRTSADVEKIITSYKKTLELFPDNPKAMHNLGTLYNVFKQDPKQALQYLNKALTYDTLNTKVLVNISQSYFIMKQWDSTEKYCNKVIGIDVQFFQAWDFLFRTYFAKQDTSKLQPYLDPFTKTFPNNDLAYSTMGSICISLKDTLKGISFLEKAIEITPQNPEKIKPIYNYYVKKGNTEKANYYYKKMNGGF